MDAIEDIQEQYWKAIRERDRSFDGQFFYGVLTTGIFCRPSCPSREPKRTNVRFYKTSEAATADGLRPCKRCRPAEGGDSAGNNRIQEVCRYLEEHSEENLSLGNLAERIGWSPFHLQRTFKAVLGISPKQYLDQIRMNSFKSSLRKPENDVTQSIFDAGYGSISRVYEKLDSHLGMTPMEYRSGGAGVAISFGMSSTPLGFLMVGATDRGICFIQFGEDEQSLLQTMREQYPKATISPMVETPLFKSWMDQLNQYLEGKRPDLSLPVHVQATAFQLMVWRHLQTIPAGKVESYSEVAKAIGRPTAVRAVARACATNAVALAIPCHRVIRGTGELGGYRWGIGRKRTILDMERRNA